MKYTGFGISIRLVCRNYTFDRVYVDLSILRVLGFLEGAYMQDLFLGNALGDASAHTKPAYLHASLSSLSRMKLTDMVSIRNVSTSSGTDLKELHVIMWLRGLPLRMHRWAVGGPSPLFWPNFTACMRSGIVWTWERDMSIVSGFGEGFI